MNKQTNECFICEMHLRNILIKFCFNVHIYENRKQNDEVNHENRKQKEEVNVKYGTEAKYEKSDKNEFNESQLSEIKSILKRGLKL